MEIRFTAHARRRMSRYGVEEGTVREALRDPDEVVAGHSGRWIAHRILNGYVLRVVYEEREEHIVVVTVYPARRDRYEV